MKLVIPSLLLASSVCHGAMLLINPGVAAPAYSTFSSAQPYAVASTDIWNSGTGSQYGNTTGDLQYSDGTAATGVRVVTDAMELVGGVGQYNFAAASAAVAGNNNIGSGSGVFNGSSNPSANGSYGGTVSGLSNTGVATKITGLPSGTYDLYIVAAYTGTNSSTHPGGSSPAQQSLWAYAAASTAATTLDTGTFGPVTENMENSTRASWVNENNYLQVQVTIDSATPDLYIISEGAVNDQLRGWISSIQIVQVPEPSALALVGLGSILLLGSRRRAHRA